MKTLTLELEVAHTRPIYGEGDEATRRVTLIGREGTDAQTVSVLTEDPDFVGAPHGTPVTVTFTLGAPPAPAPAPEEHD